MKRIVLSVFVLLAGLEIKSDIAPYPIKAKGIAANEPTEIKMTYERVTIDLTLDSSFVHCYFKMHNEGQAQNIQIGYPNMNYYSYQQAFMFFPIEVYENGKKYDSINAYTPDLINLFNNENYIINLPAPNFEDLIISDSNNYSIKPWYLWNTHFAANETKIIEVSYKLPRGLVKNDLYCTFDYLLSTGAGWKGEIDTAEIIVNLLNFDSDLILKASPANFSTTGNQIVWKFYDINPTIKDDISISYERSKGQYEERLRQVPLPVYYP